MNILNKIAEKRYEEATHLVRDLVRNGKLPEHGFHVGFSGGKDSQL